jgi:putative serine protease PepD
MIIASDGRIFEAEVMGTDPTTDLAVLKIKSPPADLKESKLGDSGSVVVGEPVMAVGNPLGYDNTVTTGIVSALSRPVTTVAQGMSGNEAVVTNAIQVDAAINPGNSGGPLFNSQGEVIGINSSIATLDQTGSQTAGSIGLAFAIPSNLVKNVATQLIEQGEADHPFLGVTPTDKAVSFDGQMRAGAQVDLVQSGSAAEEAGLRKGDVVLSLDGNPITGASSLTAWVRSYLPGDKVTLEVLRGSQLLEIEATLKSRTP